MTTVTNWNEVYNSAELGKKIGSEVINEIKSSMCAVTHDGVYHADDVFCMELINYVIGEEVTFLRTREEQSHFTFDVGGGSFDHHQCDEFRNGNNDGILASFGKLWCTIGRNIGLREEVWKEIDSLFVQEIDLTDNTGKMNPVNFAINATKHLGIGEEGLSAARAVAREMLKNIIESGLKKSRELDLFFKEIENRNSDSDVLILTRHFTVTRDVYQKFGINWIIFPDIQAGTFNLQAVGNKKLKDSQSSDEDVKFIHKGLWLAKTKSIEAALRLVV